MVVLQDYEYTIEVFLAWNIHENALVTKVTVMKFFLELCILKSRIAPDIRPAGYLAFFDIRIRPDIRFRLPDIRLAG